MDRYSIYVRDEILVKNYEFLSFAKSIGKNIGKNMSKTLSGKCSQKLNDHAKKFATDVIKTVLEKSNPKKWQKQQAI